MTKKERAKLVLEALERLYPQPPIPLAHSDAYTLLIAVLLSAQCTDARVNSVTPELFALADNPQDMLKVSIDEIQQVIRTCGLSPTKAKNIWNLSRILVEQHNCEVPNTFDELEALPGVGHKTASVVMSQAFGLPALAVDTHIHRCAKRWGLSNGSTVERTEADLKRLFPKKTWSKLHLQIIHFARKYCPARQHDPDACPICSQLQGL